MSLLSAKTLDNNTKPDTTNCSAGPKNYAPSLDDADGKSQIGIPEIVIRMVILHDNCRHVDVDFDALVRQDEAHL